MSVFKLLSGLFLLGVVFSGAFYFGKTWQRLEGVGATGIFQPALHPIGNCSFAVVIIGHNNGAFVEKTLQSVFSQNYLNFRIFYVDDASDDGSFELARDLIYESGQMMRVEMIQNEERLGVPISLARIVEQCTDQEIVVVVGGEDWLAHKWVLSRLNQYYANPDLWLTFGQYRQYPEYTTGFYRPLAEDKPVRQQSFTASHVKTFYAALFRRIDPKDLQIPTDFAYMVPMLEMAKGHATFISEILYIENWTVFKQEDWEAASVGEGTVRMLEPYLPIDRIAS